MNSIYNDIMSIDYNIHTPIDNLLAINERYHNFEKQIEYLLKLRFGSRVVYDVEGFYINDEEGYIRVCWIRNAYPYDREDVDSYLPLEWLLLPKDELESMIDSIRTEEARIEEEKQKELDRLKQLQLEEKELKEYERLKQKYGN